MPLSNPLKVDVMVLWCSFMMQLKSEFLSGQCVTLNVNILIKLLLMKKTFVRYPHASLSVFKFFFFFK